MGQTFLEPASRQHVRKAVATNSLPKSRMRTRAVNEWLHMGQSGAISNIQLDVALTCLERKRYKELLEHGRKLGRTSWDVIEELMPTKKCSTGRNPWPPFCPSHHTTSTSTHGNSLRNSLHSRSGTCRQVPFDTKIKAPTNNCSLTTMTSPFEKIEVTSASYLAFSEAH